MKAVIIAAGESSRFWPLNQGHKSQIKILGLSLISRTINSLIEAGIREVVLVHGYDSSIKEDIDSNNFGIKINYVLQEKPLGTGNAVMLAKKFIDEPFFALNPYKINAGEIIEKMKEKNNNMKGFGPKIVLGSTTTTAAQDYGMLEFDGDKIMKIYENPPPGKEVSNIKTLGFYFLHPDFFRYYESLASHHEEDLIDTLNAFIKDRGASHVFFEKNPPTLKYPWNLFDFAKEIFESEDFKNYISPSAIIGKNVIINGKVFIGDNVSVGDGTIINGPCFIADGCRIGFNNILRGPCDLEKNVKTGAFFEMKNSIVQENTTFHSGYVGDSIIGKDCKFGAGFITANLRMDRETVRTIVKGEKKDTGLKKLGVIVGNNTRFGIKCGTMPGIMIGSSCVIGPGSFIFENIEDGATFYTKFEKIIKKQNKD